MTESEQRHLPVFLDAPRRLRLLTAAEVAERLRVPVPWVRKNGKGLPGTVRIGKYIRWDAARLDAFIGGGGHS